VGAAATRDDEGRWLPVFQHAQAMVLLVAGALGVPALDGIYPRHQDPEGLRRRIAAARLEGFSGMLAIHPAQLAVINSGFEPTAEEIAHARRVVQAFAAANGAGVITLDGRMLDRPHLRRAERLLAAAPSARTAG
jgi:citrate lyase subunit beta/citryl-CoA lyase